MSATPLTGPLIPGRRTTSSPSGPSLAAMAASSSGASPAMRRLFSARSKARRIQQKRKPAKDKRRNETREFGVDSVRAQRAKHEGDQDRRSGSSPPGNQHTEATENFEQSDDILSVGGVAPLREPLGPSHSRGPFELRNADQDKCHSQEDGARPHYCSWKPDHGVSSCRRRVQSA